MPETPGTRYANPLQGRPGIYVPEILMGADGKAVPTSERLFFMRFFTPRQMHIKLVSFNVEVVGGATDPLDFGIMSETGERLTHTGEVQGKLNTAAVAEVLLPEVLTLNGGTIYYAAIGFKTTAEINMCTVGQALVWALFGSALPNVEAGFKAATFPIPSGITTPTGGAVAAVPKLCLREI